MGERWIKIHRRMLEWEWFTDSTTLKLFIFMLFQANYKEYRYMGNAYPEGSFICQRERLESCGLTTKQVRHSLEKLKSTGEITTKTLGHATLFTITNWSKYQITDGPNKNDTQDTDYQHDTCIAPYDDGHSDGQTDGQRDGYTDGHSDGHTIQECIEGIEDSLNAHTHTHTHTRIREDGDIPNAPYNPSQGFGAPPIIPYPKTAKEVIDAATMQGVPMTSEDAQDFLDRNEALGWLINNQPIRDWRRMLRGWINKANQYRRTHNNGNRQQQRFDTKHVPRPDEYGEGDAF